ncbi:hypothetical protein HYV70_02360 [Candidatus Uhrbacteria bacterium]|nr:hypothetical protein [Candidatus Uhrbacteria bacterium]
MSETGPTYKGHAHITTPNGNRNARRVDMVEIDGGKHRLTIHGVGEAEIHVQQGRFENEPWATNGQSGHPEIHRIGGVAEQTNGQIKGRFKITRDGKQTSDGEFNVRQQKKP